MLDCDTRLRGDLKLFARLFHQVKERGLYHLLGCYTLLRRKTLYHLPGFNSRLKGRGIVLYVRL